MPSRSCATRVGSAAALGVLALLANRVHADGDADYFSPTDEHVRVSLGAMRVSNQTSLLADSSAGVPGTTIEGENQFGLARSDFEPKLQALFRVDTRQRISFDYFTLNRSGNAVVSASAPIVFRDVVFTAGDPLQTQLNLSMVSLAYEYSFWHSEWLELAATLGVHETDVSTTAKVQTATQHILQQQDAAGPVPTVGIDATWIPTRRFYVDARAQYLDVHVKDIGGSLGIYELAGLYRIRPNVAFALGYTEIRAYLSSTKTSNAGVFDFNTKGPELFVRVSF